MSLDPTRVDRIRELVGASRRILLVTHVDPDGDAIGSLLGLGGLLRAQGHETQLTCQDPVPELYRWLPGSEQVAQRAAGLFDLLISLDCSDERRMGQVAVGDDAGTSTPAFAALATLAPLVNIDHHVTNTQFGAVNLVEPSYAATAHIILDLAGACGWELTRDVAICLMTGLVTDTRGFRTENVDVATMRAALQLTEAGASAAETARRTLDERPLAAVRLWGEAFGQLHRSGRDGEIVWTEISLAMVERWSAGDEATKGLTNFLAGVREAKVVVVFSEGDDGTVDVGLRARPGYDVAQVAVALGGGGHPQASGCTLDAEGGGLEPVRKKVLDAVQRSLEEQDRRRGQERPGPGPGCRSQGGGNG